MSITIISLSQVEKEFQNAVEAFFVLDPRTFFLIIFSTLSIYIAVVCYTRIFGKRSFSKMSSFDFAMTLAVGSMIATTILSDEISFLEGALGLLCVYVFQLSAGVLRRYGWFRKMIDNQPTILMEGETIFHDNMNAVRVTESDLRSRLRACNVIKLSDIKAVIFETTGDIVVMHKDNDEAIDEWLLKDVQR